MIQLCIHFSGMSVLLLSPAPTSPRPRNDRDRYILPFTLDMPTTGFFRARAHGYKPELLLEMTISDTNAPYNASGTCSIWTQTPSSSHRRSLGRHSSAHFKRNIPEPDWLEDLIRLQHDPRPSDFRDVCLAFMGQLVAV